jgi:predicted DNA-binding transcriptional regulator AlpA
MSPAVQGKPCTRSVPSFAFIGPRSAIKLHRSNVTMRRGGPPAHSVSTEQIVELRDQGLTWTQVAEQVGMTRSGAWSPHRRTRPPKQQRLGRWQQVLADALDQTQ